jgi:ubiquinone/menaquinone biosynthesis C-methylase UbiE
MEQSKYWDSVAFVKTFNHHPVFEEFGKYVNKNSRILDYGCGYGQSLNEFSRQGYANLFGVDFSEQMTERGKKEYPHLNLINNDGRHIPFDDRYFDAVVLFAVLTCIAMADDQLFLINETKRVLKTGGIIYISDLLINTDQRNILRYSKFKDKYDSYGVFELPEGALLKHHSEKWIIELTQQFQRLWYKKFEVTTMNGNRSNAFQYIGQRCG